MSDIAERRQRILMLMKTLETLHKLDMDALAKDLEGLCEKCSHDWVFYPDVYDSCYICSQCNKEMRSIP